MNNKINELKTKNENIIKDLKINFGKKISIIAKNLGYNSYFTKYF